MGKRSPCLLFGKKRSQDAAYLLALKVVSYYLTGLHSNKILKLMAIEETKQAFKFVIKYI